VGKERRWEAQGHFLLEEGRVAEVEREEKQAEGAMS